jgi:O-acetyl-ADP-ribose deacetylase (regulator of RNase III)
MKPESRGERGWTGLPDCAPVLEIAALTVIYAHATISAGDNHERGSEEHSFPSGKRLQIVQGDLTQESVDAIVNAANAQLQHGGGVAGAISRGGGPQIQAESDAWVRQHGPVTHSKPAYTGAGNLSCRYVIHTVGPVWGEGDEDNKLTMAVSSSLRLGDRLGLDSMALPAISTGIFGFPKERAAELILSAIQEYFNQNPSTGLQLVRLTLFDQPMVDTFLRGMESKDLGE